MCVYVYTYNQLSYSILYYCFNAARVHLRDARTVGTVEGIGKLGRAPQCREDNIL